MPIKLRFTNEWDAIEYLKHDVKITEKVIMIKKNALGLKKWGAVDYLVNFHQYYAYIK